MEKEKTYGVWAVRSAASIFGRAESWCKEAGRPLEFASQETAEAYAKECNSRTTANVHYFVKEKEPEPGAVRKDGTQPDRAAPVSYTHLILNVIDVIVRLTQRQRHVTGRYSL